MTKAEMLTALEQARNFIDARAKMACVGDGAMLLLSWCKALELAIGEIQAHEPRVMTIDEIKDYNDTMYMEIHDAKDVFAVLYVGINLYHMSFQSSHYSFHSEPSGYNSLWRCWTNQPTDEQREATPWSM